MIGIVLIPRVVVEVGSGTHQGGGRPGVTLAAPAGRHVVGVHVLQLVSTILYTLPRQEDVRQDVVGKRVGAVSVLRLHHSLVSRWEWDAGRPTIPAMVVPQ